MLASNVTVVEFLTHMETLPLLVESCQCRPILGTHSHSALSSDGSLGVTPSVTRGVHSKRHLRGLKPVADLRESGTTYI